MEAYRSVDVVVAFGRKEKKLDAPGRLLPFVADNCLHHISLRLLVLGQHGCGSVPVFQPLACVVEKFLVGDEVPIRLLVLKFDFHKVFIVTEINNCPLESGLDEAFDRPGLAALDHGFVNDPGAGAADGFHNLLGSFGPMKAEGGTDLFRMRRFGGRKAEKSGPKP